MKVGFFQYAVFQRDVKANLDYLETKLQSTQFDLLVLPELFTSGYAFDHSSDIEPYVENIKHSYTVNRLKEIAQNSKGYITGTIPEIDNNKIYNTAIMVGPEGLIYSFRKIHLTDYEKRIFTPGENIDVYQRGDAKVGTVICFDIWFAPLSSKLKQLGAQIICHSSCFGGDVTPKIIPIRALENQYYVISCNRIGTELFEGQAEDYRGESQIVDPDGHTIIKASNEELLAFTHIDLSLVNNPAFGSLITNNFLEEHDKYTIALQSKS